MVEDDKLYNYTSNFNIEIVTHVVSILNQGRNFKSNFEYSFKIGDEHVCVKYDNSNSCLTINVQKNEDSLIIKKFDNILEFIVTQNGITSKSVVNDYDGGQILTLKK